jgi:1,4-alpha-glucan branching enzyme
MKTPRKPKSEPAKRSKSISRGAVAVVQVDGEPSIPDHELKRLLDLVHPSPHSILGAHPTPDGVRVRALRPYADKVLLHVGNETHEMKRTHAQGFFEFLVENAQELFPYELEIFTAGGNFKLKDPYTFLPTIGDLDIHLFAEGRHENIYDKLGSHHIKLGDVAGTAFSVWAPDAKGISVVGDFNMWDGRVHQMRVLGSSGIWELFIPGLEPGTLYKYEIRTKGGHLVLKSDPYAFQTETPPNTASIVYNSNFQFTDHEWMKTRDHTDPHKQPISIYEVHLGSWKRIPEEGNRSYTYREMAPALTSYVKDLGFTHVEFLPIAEHPFGGSWGYQVSGYYAPTSRFGTPDDFKYLVNYLHENGIGVILDWVPAHFPKDAFSLGRFDGTALYEHLDPKLGEHPDWGTYIFNYGRNEVRNFLKSNALFWHSEYHIDGLRSDAVASMLYLNYSRNEGEWIPNRYGGKENLEAISLIQETNELIYQRHPGAMMIAEESTDWGGVSRPTYTGGLGFGFKWNMGWMHDTLLYMTKEPVHRRYHHNNLTFGLIYAWSENFILPLSHDEVVHGKRSLLSKMPGDRWQQFANLRALYAYMWAHPGKKLLFMGGEIGQWDEWNYNESIDWHLLMGEEHRGIQQLIKDLNRIYRENPALWEADSEPNGFQWIDCNSADDNTVSFIRISPSTGKQIICVCNFSPVVRYDYKIGLPKPGWYKEILNTDSEFYAGSNVGNINGMVAVDTPQHWLPYSATLVLPPLSTCWFEVPS